jgi:hypothetical protein
MTMLATQPEGASEQPKRRGRKARKVRPPNPIRYPVAIGFNTSLEMGEALERAQRSYPTNLCLSRSDVLRIAVHEWLGAKAFLQPVHQQTNGGAHP